MCSTLVEYLACLKKCLRSYDYKGNDGYSAQWIKERNIYLCSALVEYLGCLKKCLQSYDSQRWDIRRDRLKKG